MADASSQVREAIDAARAAVSEEAAPSLDDLQAAGAAVQSALAAQAEQLDTLVARGPATRRELWRLLLELHQLEREFAERRYLRRADALERVQEAVRHLGEIGSAAGILERAAQELGEGSDFDRVIVSSIRDGELQVESAWTRAGDESSALKSLRPMRLDYPLVEAELVGKQGCELVSLPDAHGRVDRGWAEVLGWSSYAVATIALGGTTAGLVHADCEASARALDAIDQEVLGIYADGLAQVFERAVLRGRLHGHRSELRGAVDWMTARLSSLAGPEPDGAGNGVAASALGRDALGRVTELDELLTPRELEVLRLMARGNTNQGIATALVVAEGTVKYHVKNILRKLRAANRAEAVARYERMTG